MLGVDRRHADLFAPDVGERRDERGHVEEVAQAFAVRFEQHGKRSVLRGDRQQVGRLLPLLPERRAHAGPPLRQEQRSRGVLAKLRRKERRRAELADNEGLHFVRIGKQELHIRRLVDIRKPDDEPVVSPQRLDVDAALFANLRRGRHRPRRMNAPAAR